VCVGNIGRDEGDLHSERLFGGIRVYVPSRKIGVPERVRGEGKSRVSSLEFPVSAGLVQEATLQPEGWQHRPNGFGSTCADFLDVAMRSYRPTT
jgi:hypothetical protein